jgi:hypothetical protein
MTPRSLVLALGLLLPRAGHADCTDKALVTLEAGAIVNVEWPVRTATELHGRAITNATLETEYTIALRADGSTEKVTQTAHALGDKPVSAELAVPAGTVFWSDRLPSTLEQIVIRAHGATAKVALAATSKDVPHEAQVERIDANDWSVILGPRRYEVVVDDHGCLEAASLPAYGITFERREVAAASYPLEGKYTAPHDAPYTAIDVKITAPQGHVLAGTLTRPKGNKRTAAVVMITGISKHERNEGAPPYTPFRDIADILGRAGIAVLRVDDRGIGASTGDFDKATSFDEADDVQTEVAWLRKQPGIDPKRVALVGHSEGGFIALVVAAKDPTIAAIALLAGSGVPGEQLNTWQTIETVNHDPAVAPAQRDAEIKKQLADRSDWSPRDKAFVAADPADFAAKVKAPTLILQGGSDLHVPPRSVSRLTSVLHQTGNRDVTVRLLPQLSHVLSPDVIGSLQAWSWLPSRRLSNELLDTLASWLKTKL